jgi:hypothetical protein
MNNFREIAASRDEVLSAQQIEEAEEIEAEPVEAPVEEAPAGGAE